MSVIVHHGHPGSYKSFGVIQRHMVPELIKGREVVTNIRGFDSIDKVESALGVTLPDTAKIYYVDTVGQKARDHMARWFHWAPKGALVVIDEAQNIYPTSRRSFKLENLDYPGGADKAAEDERPFDVMEAFDMHRHYNWDIFICTPNIDKIHSEIRQVAQIAFRHYSMGELLPWKKGKWREVEHDPQNNGKAKSHAFGVPKEYKASPEIFATYQSTKTGEHKQNVGPGNVLKDKKLIGLGIVVLICFGLFIHYAVAIFERERGGGSSVPLDPEQSNSALIASVSDGIGGGGPAADNSDINDVIGVLEDHPLSDATISITGRVGSEQMFVGKDDQGEFSLTQRDLFSHGYSYVSRSPCRGELLYGGKLAQTVYCARVYIVPDDYSQFDEGQDLEALDNVTAALSTP